MAIAATITNAGLDFFTTVMTKGDSFNNVFIAVGTGTTAPSVSDTKLQSESSTSGSRIAGTIIKGTNHGEVTISATMATTDAVGVVIGEAGVFVGSAASTTKDTGTLLMRANYSHTKTNSETLTLSFDFTV